MLQLLIYPKCSTCQKAVRWLNENGVEYHIRNIVEDPLSVSELRNLHLESNLPLKKFFNTSGIKYRELNLKDKIPQLTDEELYELLASDGMLVKRPLVYDRNQVTLGFKLLEYEAMWLNS